MNYDKIFQPKTLANLNRKSAENLRAMLGNKTLMQTIQSSQTLLTQIGDVEAPYRDLLEPLAIEMVEKLYPIVTDENINIDAKLVSIAEVGQSLDEIKVNKPLNLVVGQKYEIFDEDAVWGEYDGWSECTLVDESPNSRGEVLLKFQYENEFETSTVPKDKWIENGWIRSSKSLDEDLTPEGRRRIINGITQGAALKGAFSFYLFKEYLDAIDETLIDKYNEIMKNSFGIYDDENAIAMMLSLLAQGHKMAGGSSKVVMNEIKVTNPTIRFTIYPRDEEYGDTYSGPLYSGDELVSEASYDLGNELVIDEYDYTKIDPKWREYFIKADDDYGYILNAPYKNSLKLNEISINKPNKLTIQGTDFRKYKYLGGSEELDAWINVGDITTSVNINGRVYIELYKDNNELAKGFNCDPKYFEDMGHDSEFDEDEYVVPEENAKVIGYATRVDEISINNPTGLDRMKRRAIKLLDDDREFSDGDEAIDDWVDEIERCNDENTLYEIIVNYCFGESEVVDGYWNDITGVESLKEAEQSGITIKARAICFPMLVHEIIKGLYEVVSLHGFKGSKEDNQKVVDKVDKLENEPHDIKNGKFIYEAINNILVDNNYTDPRVREFFFQEIYQLPDAEFLPLIENAINEELTPYQNKWCQSTLKDIASDLTADDFEATGLDEIAINKPSRSVNVQIDGSRYELEIGWYGYRNEDGDVGFLAGQSASDLEELSSYFADNGVPFEIEPFSRGGIVLVKDIYFNSADSIDEISINKPWTYKKAWGEVHSFEEWENNKRCDNFCVNKETGKIVAGFTGYNVAWWAGWARVNLNHYDTVSLYVLRDAPQYGVWNTPIDREDPESWAGAAEAERIVRLWHEAGNENINEITINNPVVTLEKLQDLFSSIYSKIEDYWDDDNQSILVGLDSDLGDLLQKYSLDPMDGMITDEDVQDLTSGQINLLYNDLIKFQDELPPLN